MLLFGNESLTSLVYINIRHKLCVCTVRQAITVIKATIIKVLFAEMYVNVVFVIRCLYSAMSLTLVKE